MANSVVLKIHQLVDNAGSADGQTNYVLAQGHMLNLMGNDIVIGDGGYQNWGTAQYQFAQTAATGGAENKCWWDHGYACVNHANKLLNYLDDATVGGNKKLKDYKARALILRAWGYHYMVELYQDPYTNGGQDKLGLSLYEHYDPGQPYRARANLKDTYEFMIKDLKEAGRLLEEAGIGYTTEEEGDFDKGVAMFLLARITLWYGEYQMTVDAAKDILQHHPNLIAQQHYGGKNTGTADELEFLPENNAFLNMDVNPEIILGFKKGIVPNNTAYNNWMNPFANGWGGANQGYAKIDDRLYKMIAINDVRKYAFVDDKTLGNYTYHNTTTPINIQPYTNLKFAATHALNGNKQEVGQNDNYYMRTAEVLLMLAEALNELENTNEAINTINTLLQARTLPDHPTLTIDNYPNTQHLTLKQKIQLQWRIEMWGENAREFANNKRWNITVDRIGSTNHWVTNKILTPKEMTFQIPENERLYNPLCVPN
jgi:hypothetical protein